jgi:hypothetical protein
VAAKSATAKSTGTSHSARRGAPLQPRDDTRAKRSLRRRGEPAEIDDGRRDDEDDERREVEEEEREGEGREELGAAPRGLTRVVGDEREAVEQDRDRRDEAEQPLGERAVPEERRAEQAEALVVPEGTEERAKAVGEPEGSEREQDEVGSLGAAHEERQRRAHHVVEPVLRAPRALDREELLRAPRRIPVVAQRGDHRHVLGQIGERQVARREERRSSSERAQPKEPRPEAGHLRPLPIRGRRPRA